MKTHIRTLTLLFALSVIAGTAIDAQTFPGGGYQGGAYGSGGVEIITDAGPVAALNQEPMFRAFPNPFRQRIEIQLTMETDQVIDLSVFDLQNRKIINLTETGGQPSGTRVFYWDGLNAEGSPVSEGIYFCRLTFKNAAYTRKILFLGRQVP